MHCKLIFAWYDLWVGAFWDQRKRWLYLFPLPCLGIVLMFKPQLETERTIDVRHLRNQANAYASNGMLDRAEVLHWEASRIENGDYRPK